METPIISRRSYVPWIWEVLVRCLAALMYRVRAYGVDNVPASGGALIVANHLSYVDPLLIQLACPRKIRWVGAESIRRSHGFFAWIYRMTGTISVAPESALDTTRKVVKALQAGEVVCLFPEGGISRTGQLMALQRGYELMALKGGVPVIPVAHDGIWGSVFSFSGNKLLFKSPRQIGRAHV